MDFDDDGRQDNNKYIDWKVLSTNSIIILQLQSHFKQYHFLFLLLFYLQVMNFRIFIPPKDRTNTILFKMDGFLYPTPDCARRIQFSS